MIKQCQPNDDFRKKQHGNIVLVTVIIILLISVVVTTCINLSHMQVNLAGVSRNTSNTYSLAAQSVQKQVDTINKALQVQLPQIVKDIDKTYVSKIYDSTPTYNDIVYQTVNGSDTLTVDKIDEKIAGKVFDFVNTNYVGKPIEYVMQGDRAANGAKTTVKVTVSLDGSSTSSFIVKAVATTDNGSETYDQEKVSGKLRINIPTINELNARIMEYYKWNTDSTDQPCLSEFLDAPIVCFSDAVIKDGAELTVASGDLLVKGIKQKGSSGASTMDADTTGGIIVKNGGELNVTNGNVYCVSNIIATTGWDKSDYTIPSTISIGGDAVAYSIGILSDYYEGAVNQQPYTHQGQSNSITVGGNAVVDNDVLVDRWTKDCIIDIAGTIFGTGGTASLDDPNSSSGVFCQGADTSKIKAGRMYVAGQPFITLEKGGTPLRLLESIGEPFDGVNSIVEYRDGDNTKISEAINKLGTSEALYLSPDSPFRTLINADKIETALTKSYAPAAITASGTIGKKPESNSDTFSGVPELQRFLYNGGPTASDTKKSIADYTDLDDSAYYDKMGLMVADAAKYYKCDSTFNGKGKMYYKDFMPTVSSLPADVLNNNSGVKAYSTAVRSAFYNGFNADGTLKERTFDNLTNKVVWPDNKDKYGNPVSWSYENPIEVVEGGEIDISKYYVDGTCYPTIIVSKGKDKTLTIKTNVSGDNKFNGVIFSEGKVILDGTSPIELNGSIIIGGPEKTSLTNEDIYKSEENCGLLVKGDVTVNKDSDMIFNVELRDRKKYQQVLNLLELCQYKVGSPVTDIMGKYVNITDKDIAYTEPKLRYTNKTYLQVDTSKVCIRIDALKKD